MDGIEKKEENGQNRREEIFSKAVRAGRRTYFFDVKATRKDDYYLTITESKKRFNKRGRYYFEKFKIFLYKEDFEKFTEGLESAIDFIKSHYNYDEDLEHQHHEPEEKETSEETVSQEDYTKVEFDDLNEN